MVAGVRNHLQANHRSIAFRFEIQASDYTLESARSGRAYMPVP